ncbi:glycosyltransferase family A protein [Bifidobacterium mongoliense]|uniref:glycosyltransferase family 2 protein n=1 Tax=Bifidobacterium mongoliense TaxID=518643 RepID=UPI0030ECE7B8
MIQADDKLREPDNGALAVSVIVPVYKTRPERLRTCLESIVPQLTDGITLQCIVVFDGKPETEQLAVIEELNTKGTLEYYVIQHGGVSAARNEGIPKAKGTWVSFVDADDKLPDHALLPFVRCGEKYSCDIVQGAYQSKLGSSTELHAYRQHEDLFTDDELIRFREDILNPGKGTGLVWGKLFRRDFLLASSMQFDIHLSMGEDAAFAFEAAEHATRVGVIPQVMYVYQRNQDSAVSRFREDYPHRIQLALEAMREHINNSSNKALYEHAYRNFVLFHLLLVQQHYLFHPEAPWDNTERKQHYRHILSQEPYRSTLETGKFEEPSLAKRVALYALRFHCYALSRLVSKVRQRQLQS